MLLTRDVTKTVTKAVTKTATKAVTKTATRAVAKQVTKEYTKLQKEQIYTVLQKLTSAYFICHHHTVPDISIFPLTRVYSLLLL